jgi:hypothetical protein
VIAEDDVPGLCSQRGAKRLRRIDSFPDRAKPALLQSSDYESRVILYVVNN